VKNLTTKLSMLNYPRAPLEESKKSLVSPHDKKAKRGMKKMGPGLGAKKAKTTHAGDETRFKKQDHRALFQNQGETEAKEKHTRGTN